MSDQKIIEAFAAARLSGEKMNAYPGPSPQDMAEAFAIQCAVRDRLGWTHAVWKIGCTSEKAQAALKTDGPFPGPIYKERLYQSGAHIQTHASNFRTTEPEIAFTLAQDIPIRSGLYSVDECLAAVATVHPSIEIVNPRLPKGFDDIAEWYVADGGLNDALAIGVGVKPLERAQYSKIGVVVRINGVEKYAGIGANALGGPEIALTWLANHLISRNQHLRAGDVVTTGVITGIFESEAGDEVSADYTLLGAISVRL